MSGKGLNELESILFKSTADYKNTVEAMITEINRRNEARVEDEKRRITAARTRKKAVELVIIFAAMAASVIFYHFTMGMFW